MSQNKETEILSEKDWIIDKLLKQKNMWENAYYSIYNSNFWQKTAPIRKSIDFIKTKTSGIDNNYYRWIENNEKDILEKENLSYNPLISVITPVYNVEDKLLCECIESVINQTYENWELILINDSPSNNENISTIKQYCDNKRIFFINNENNLGISESTNKGLAIAKGEFVTFLDNDDLIAPNALYEVAKLLNENKELDFIYSDEDKIDAQGKKRFNPHFKPDYSPDTLLWSNYTRHLSIYRKSIVDKIGGLKKEYDGAQDYDFVLRFVEKTTPEKIGHISKILYHWRAIEGSTARNTNAKSNLNERTQKVKLDALNRRKLIADIKRDEVFNIDHLLYENNNELVSIIIPSKDNYDVLKRCIDSIKQKSTYSNYEIIVVDNGSNEDNKNQIEEFLNSVDVKYIYEIKKFNYSYMCNLGANNSSGEYLLFLNDDTEVIEPNWIEIMLGQARLEHIGAVGAKLYYPNSKLIQHCGVVCYSDGPVPYLNHCDDNFSYYFSRNKADYNVLAVTGACLMVEKKKYKEISGFNEELPNDFNDIDFCINLYEKGYFNIIRNDVTLYHYESLTRKENLQNYNNTLEFLKDLYKLHIFNPTLSKCDPFYNRNLLQRSLIFEISGEEQ